MGLDTSHNCWHAPYSSFNTFRKLLASRIGMVLDNMEGFGGDGKFAAFDHDIIPLLDHSDCDGEITPADAAKVARGLEAIYADLTEEEKNWNCGYKFGEAIQNWISGCKEAAAKNEPIHFG